MFWSILKTVMSPQVVTDGSQGERAVVAARWVGIVRRVVVQDKQDSCPMESAIRRKGLMPWVIEGLLRRQDAVAAHGELR